MTKANLVLQGITGSWEMHIVSSISFLSDLNFYDEERNELS